MLIKFNWASYFEKIEINDLNRKIEHKKFVNRGYELEEI